GAMQVAAEHAEAVRQRTRMSVEKRLLLYRIALHAADVAPGDEQRAAAIEADLAHPSRAVGQRTAVAARDATQPAVRHLMVELACACLLREHLRQCGHGIDLIVARWHAR